jgi:hypothetical protein
VYRVKALGLAITTAVTLGLALASGASATKLDLRYDTGATALAPGEQIFLEDTVGTTLEATSGKLECRFEAISPEMPLDNTLEAQDVDNDKATDDLSVEDSTLGTDGSLRCSGTIPGLGDPLLAIGGVKDLSLDSDHKARMRILDAMDLGLGECKYKGTLTGTWSTPTAVSVSFEKQRMSSVTSISAAACPKTVEQSIAFAHVEIAVKGGSDDPIEAFEG